MLLVLFSSMAAYSQSRHTLTNDDFVPWTTGGFYGSFDYSWSSAGDLEFSVNKINAMLLPNHHWGIGAAFSSVNQNKLNHCGINELYYGGPQVEYLMGSHRLISPSFFMCTGLAYCSDCTKRERILTFAEPGARLWLNIASFMRISINASFRFFQQKQNLSMDEVNGFSYGFSIAYGKF